MSEAIIDALRRRYMESVGNPARQLIGGGVRGYFGLDMPEYADTLGREAYANAQALGNAPGIGAPAGAFKAMAAAPLVVKALKAGSLSKPQAHWKPNENLSVIFESAGMKVKNKGSAHSNSRYVEIEDPVTGELVVVRFADHPVSGRAMALHGSPDFNVGEFENANFKNWDQAAAATLERINRTRAQFGDDPLRINFEFPKESNTPIIDALRKKKQD